MLTTNLKERGWKEGGRDERKKGGKMNGNNNPDDEGAIQEMKSLL
jgi:hypothetical protein